MQAFKENDELEKKVTNIFKPLLNGLLTDKFDFQSNAFRSYPLGDVLFDTERSPLAGAISKDVFRESFFAIHDLFTRPGTFEFYLNVFRAIFGNDVDVEFEVPAPGKLNINVQSNSLVLDFLQARRIESGEYVYYDLITQPEGDNLVAQVPKGPKTQSEIDAIMIELTPHGILVNTTLTVD